MPRTSSRPIGVLLGALALTGLAASPAAAAEGAMDGSITAEGQDCSWTGAVTSDQAPNPLTVDRESLNAALSCSGGTTAVLNNDPTVTFDDGAGTITTGMLDISVTMVGVTCRYQATDMSAQRDGDTRTYNASVSIPLHEGGFLCPDPANVDATFSFR
ncbi:hypothetical protein [Nocardiopsis potens]|uniref:hypothetical protein n=1 Tax=Nocardiopsis potens TaxID=1246458 RepID=UPI000349CCCF|nr:hypothetical protein [Nocardiopsis potens]